MHFRQQQQQQQPPWEQLRGERHNSSSFMSQTKQKQTPSFQKRLNHLHFNWAFLFSPSKMEQFGGKTYCWIHWIISSHFQSITKGWLSIFSRHRLCLFGRWHSDTRVATSKNRVLISHSVPLCLHILGSKHLHSWWVWKREWCGPSKTWQDSSDNRFTKTVKRKNPHSDFLWQNVCDF